MLLADGSLNALNLLAKKARVARKNNFEILKFETNLKRTNMREDTQETQHELMLKLLILVYSM